LGAPHAGCRDPGRATHTASYAIHNCQYKRGLDTDLGATEPVVATGSAA
jgi:hypothetical protein